MGLFMTARNKATSFGAPHVSLQLFKCIKVPFTTQKDTLLLLYELKEHHGYALALTNSPGFGGGNVP